MATNRHVQPVARHYPSFNDAPHVPPILSNDGAGRAMALLITILSLITLSSLILQWLT